MDLAASYSEEEFAALIEREHDYFELKTGVSGTKIGECVVAFSNTDGGYIAVGVADDRTITGRRLDQGTLDGLHTAARAAHNIGRYAVTEVGVGSKSVVIVRVHRREEGFAQTSDGRLMVRRGSSNVALIGTEAWEFMSKRTLRRFENASAGVHYTNADVDLIAQLCTAYGWLPDDDLLPRLTERCLALSSGELTIAGALFLTNPATSLGMAKASIEIRRYPNEGPDYDRRVTIEGPLQNQVREAAEFVIGELGSDLVVSGLYRYDLPKLPEVVVREAVANAVAHRSYELDRTSILVEMRPDRLVVRSPGRLPEPVTVATMRQAQAARNPAVIDVLRRFSLAEDAGRGIDVMEDSMEKALLDPPEFAEDDTSVTVTLPLRGPITARERAWVADLERKGQLALTDRMLLVYAARGERLSNSRAREILGADSTQARQALQRLRDAGLFIQEGHRGGAVYTLVESLAPPAAFRMTPEELERLVLEQAATEPLNNEIVRRVTGLGRDEALTLLQRLVSQGALVQHGAKRGTRYVLPNINDVV